MSEHSHDMKLVEKHVYACGCGLTVSAEVVQDMAARIPHDRPFGASEREAIATSVANIMRPGCERRKHT